MCVLTDITLHKKVGDDVVLQPGTDPSVAITSIIWRVEANIAMQFDGTEVDSYFHFRGNGVWGVGWEGGGPGFLF